MMDFFFSALGTVIAMPIMLLFRRLKRSKKSERNVLIIQRAKIGDLVCTTPLIRAFAEHGDRVSVLCNHWSAPVLEHLPFIHEIILSDDVSFQGIFGLPCLAIQLFLRRFDVCIVSVPGSTNALLSIWTAAPLSVATSTKYQGIFETIITRFHSHRVVMLRGMRTFDHYMRLAAAAGVEAVSYRHDYIVTPTEAKWAEQWLQNNAQSSAPKVMLALSAGNRIKEWPLERFAEVGARLQKHGFTVIFSSNNREKTAQACSLLPRENVLDAGGLSLRELAAIISLVDLFVSVDTGPLYIAHALGIPVIDIIGPVDPSEQPPISSAKTVLVLPPPPITPSSFVLKPLRKESSAQRRALDETTVDHVMTAILRLIHHSDAYP